jgi:hypothetical protein
LNIWANSVKLTPRLYQGCGHHYHEDKVVVVDNARQFWVIPWME